MSGEGQPVTPAAALQTAAQASTPWGRLVAILGVLGVAFSWYAQNLEVAGSALSTPVAIVLSHFAAVGAGMAIDHFMVSRPLSVQMRERLAGMDAEIKGSKLLLDEMRSQERQNLIAMGEKAAEIAALNTSVKFLQTEIDELRAEAVQRNVKPKRPSKPRPAKT